MRFNKSSYLSKPSVAAALSLLGGAADGFKEQRQQLRQFRQKQSLASQDALQRNIDRSEESQLRLTEAQKMRAMQTANPTPMETAQLESERARTGAEKARQARYESRDPEAESKKELLYKIIGVATGDADPSRGLKRLQAFEADFGGDPQFDSTVDILKGSVQEAKVAEKQADAEKRLTRALGTKYTEMSPAERYAAIQTTMKAAGLKMEDSVDLWAHYMSDSAQMGPRSQMRQETRTSQATDAAQELIPDPWFSFQPAPTPAQISTQARSLDASGADYGDPSFAADSTAYADARRAMLGGRIGGQSEYGPQTEARIAEAMAQGVSREDAVRQIAATYGPEVLSK